MINVDDDDENENDNNNDLLGCRESIGMPDSPTSSNKLSL